MIIDERFRSVNSWTISHCPQTQAAACAWHPASATMVNMDHLDEGRGPLIVAFIDDLMSATRVEGVADRLGYQIRTIGRAEMLVREPLAGVPERPGEPLDGPLSELVETMTAWQPALLIFDMANNQIPWREWLAMLKSAPATRRIPAICYGPHVDEIALADASAITLEPDAVVPRSRFFSAMPRLITDTARVYDRTAIQADCLKPLSAEALTGLRAFDNAEYFDAHEHLEDAWNAESGAAKELYRAVLQVAVAYLQIERRNYRGALKMFLRARQWLESLPDNCRGVDIANLRLDAERVRQSLVDLGPDRIDEFDLSTLPPVRYDLSPGAAGLAGATNTE